MYVLTLKKGEEKRAFRHPWIYANEVKEIAGKDEQGSVAKVLAADGRLVGYGFINHASKIIVRILTRKEETIDRDFFLCRITAARDARLALGYEDNYRAVFAENDDLPGLIVDKYADHLSVQFLSLGMEKRKEMITDVLREVFSPACIYERSDVLVREKEGLRPVKGVLYGTLDHDLTITENGLKLRIDLENGQKTGYFLDQKENRAAIRRYAKGKRVLDCFCNQGGFSLNAALGGAAEVIAADVSETALEAVKTNAALNGITAIKTLKADVFALLREYHAAGEKFDMIVLDPPAFTKSTDTVKEGYKGYLDINTLALKLLSPKGVLVTCSCSQHLTLPLFLRMIEEASDHAKVRVKLSELRVQSPDHAAVLNMDETLYLKVAVLTAL
ncbi:MAG: class I SAM-dependent rRNA methyltransferase [Clostridia bacterium]|nr:class I SAM-dependent rRNA methyltransferase [Clostridia bacterium]